MSNFEIKGQETDEDGTPYFKCPCCKKTSYHPDDRRYGFCNACKWFTGDGSLSPSGWCPKHSEDNEDPEHPLV